MRHLWSWGIVGVIALMLGAGAAARQQQARPPVKPQAAAKKAEQKAKAKTEEEENEEQEEQGEKTYKITVELPQPIQAAFKKAYPTATIRGTAKELDNGKTVYEVESVDKGRARDLMYNPDGSVISIEEELDQGSLPAPVMAAFKKMYPKATITVAEKVTEGTKVQYDLQIKGADKPEVSFLPDGKLVPPEAAEKK
jgi:hypothetical protein